MASDSQKWCAALSYLVVGILWYMADDKLHRNAFCKFHARQGAVLFILMIIIYVIAVVPLIGWVLVPVGQIFVFVLMIIGVINAVQNSKKELPVIGRYGKKMTFL